MKGRESLKKERSLRIREKLLEILLENSEAMRNNKTPLNVEEMLEEINRSLVVADIPKVSRRAIQSVLSQYLQMGVAERHSRNRNRYYSFKKDSVAFFWKEGLKRFLDSIDAKNGSIGFGFLPLGDTKEKPSRMVGIGWRAAIIEDGIDITSNLPWEDEMKDIIGEVLRTILIIFQRELKYHLGISGNISNVTLKWLRRRLKNKKLAFVFVVDGSKIRTVGYPTNGI